MLGASHLKVAEASSPSLSMQNVVYRVYIDDEVVGLITDKDEYEAFIEQQKEELLKQYPEQMTVKSPTNVRLEEEITLLPLRAIDNEAVLQIVAEKADFQASAYKISIDDKVTFAVEDSTVVSNTLLELMVYYTGIEDIEKIMDIENPIELLTESGSQYIGAKINELVKVESGYVDPKDILTPEETRRMILYGQPHPEETVIFDGELSLWSIAYEHGLTEEELYLLNPHINGLTWEELLGIELDVTPLNLMVTVETEKEQVDITTQPYEIEYIDDDTMLKGETRIQQEGQNGESLTRMHIVYENGIQTSLEVVEETQLAEPIKEVVIRGTKVISGVGNGNWVWPTTNHNITCGYLCYSGHYAIDIQAYVGQPVYAADSGMVVSASYSSSYGNVILINHKNGYYTRYAHLDSLNVSAGDIVQGGQVIGLAGTTGNSTGPHLHFEIRTDTLSQPNYALNPLDFY
ncbi:MAG: peptidoglycan DD-metalloendopeptidase family protein [Turicibacter sp.]|nr:peptidoglycan DD-metalloendopeptidase family protein [Turicibacter sp.]